MKIKSKVAIVAAIFVFASSATAVAVTDYVRSGPAGIHFDHTVDLSMACSNTSTSISLSAGLGSPVGNGQHLNVAFTNPSVDVVDGEFFYHGTANKVADGSGDLTIADVPFKGGGVAKNGNTNVGGNPFIYYLNDGNWTYLGRCVSSSSKATNRLMHISMNLNGQAHAHAGGCASSSKSSSTNVRGVFAPDDFSLTDGTKLVMSNKELVVSGSNLYAKGRQVGNGSGSTGSYDNEGYHVAGDSVTATFGPKDILAALGDTTLKGIGGNPKIWLKAGNSSWSNGSLLGRCNNL